MEDVRGHTHRPSPRHGLALQGEAAAGWSDAERDKYHTHRMRTDSMLGVLGQRYSTIIPGGEIDTLRRFLPKKIQYSWR